MGQSPALRIALGADGISVWNAELFGKGEGSRLRAFLASAFTVTEVKDVELRREASFGRIRYGGAIDPIAIWRKLGRAFRSSGPPSTASESDARVDARLVYLDRPDERPIRVTRVGRVLCTWRVHSAGPNGLRVSHPILRNRRDVVFRLEEELSDLFGVEAFRASAVTGSVSIRFGRDTTAERIARGLEKSWPRLLDGLDGPPSRKRLFAALGLTGVAYTGQYVVPALKPLAVAGVALYGSPNAIDAVKQLRRGEVGLSTLYTAGLTFTLISGLPFTASLMALLLQFWPQLARRKIVLSQRRLFAAARRRRPDSARKLRDGVEDEIDAADLARDELVVVRGGETIPVDGVVEDGRAAVAPDASFAGTRVDRRAPGDAVTAGAVVLEGHLTIRVQRAGAQTTASFVASLLPHAPLPGLPSSLEAERVANRNVKPTLTLSALTLLATGALVPAQAVIRPDYATGPRLSAQLSVLRGLADAFQRGILFKQPAALDRLASIDTIVLDASAGIDRRHLRIARVESVRGVSPDAVVAYALAAHGQSRTEQALALSAFAAKRRVAAPDLESIERSAGSTRYRDPHGHTIEIAAAGSLAASNVDPPERFHTVLVRRSEASRGPLQKSSATDDSPARLWVLSDGRVIGAVLFARTGTPIGADLVSALAAQSPDARFVYLSRDEDDESRDLARRLGIEIARDDASSVAGAGSSTLWVGDGSDPSAGSALTASAVTVSVAPLSRSREDAADVLLAQKGLPGLVELVDVARAHAARLAADYRAVYTANLLGVGGALFASFTALHTGLLSNVGTGVIYARHAIALGRLASAAERRRARFERLVRRWENQFR